MHRMCRGAHALAKSWWPFRRAVSNAFCCHVLLEDKRQHNLFVWYKGSENVQAKQNCSPQWLGVHRMFPYQQEWLKYVVEDTSEKQFEANKGFRNFCFCNFGGGLLVSLLWPKAIKSMVGSPPAPPPSMIYIHTHFFQENTTIAIAPRTRGSPKGCGLVDNSGQKRSGDQNSNLACSWHFKSEILVIVALANFPLYKALFFNVFESTRLWSTRGMNLVIIQVFLFEKRQQTPTENFCQECTPKKKNENLFIAFVKTKTEMSDKSRCIENRDCAAAFILQQNMCFHNPGFPTTCGGFCMGIFSCSITFFSQKNPLAVAAPFWAVFAPHMRSKGWAAQGDRFVNDEHRAEVKVGCEKSNTWHAKLEGFWLVATRQELSHKTLQRQAKSISAIPHMIICFLFSTELVNKLHKYWWHKRTCLFLQDQWAFRIQLVRACRTLHNKHACRLYCSTFCGSHRDIVRETRTQQRKRASFTLMVTLRSQKPVTYVRVHAMVAERHDLLNLR